MQVERIAECSNESILQYFQPSLSYHLSLRSLFCLFLSGRLRQVLLYLYNVYTFKRMNFLIITEILIENKRYIFEILNSVLGTARAVLVFRVYAHEYTAI